MPSSALCTSSRAKEHAGHRRAEGGRRSATGRRLGWTVPEARPQDFLLMYSSCPLLHLIFLSWPCAQEATSGLRLHGLPLSEMGRGMQGCRIIFMAGTD